jgi:hypothetical protein
VVCHSHDLSSSRVFVPTYHWHEKKREIKEHWRIGERILLIGAGNEDRTGVRERDVVVYWQINNYLPQHIRSNYLIGLEEVVDQGMLQDYQD